MTGNRFRDIWKKWQISITALVLVGTIAALILVPGPWAAPIFAAIAALLVIAKEFLSTVARDHPDDGPEGEKRKRLEDWASVCSLFAAVFGAPAIAAAIFSSVL